MKTKDERQPPARAKEKASSLGEGGSNTDYQISCVAAGLLWEDRTKAALWYLILISPALCGSALGARSEGAVIMLRVFARVLDLAFLYVVWVQTLRKLSRNEFSGSFYSFGLLLIIGCLTWIAMLVPGVFAGPQTLTGAAPLLLPLSLTALICSYVFFFYHVPLILNHRSPRKILSLAYSFVARDWLLPVKVMAGPAGLMYLMLGLIAIPAPDGRYAAALYLSDLIGGTFWVLCTYTGLAAALLYLTDDDWRSAKLDPYRQARLTTLAMQSSEILKFILKPSHGYQMLAVSLIVWAGNYARLSEMPPTPHISVVSLHAQDRRVHLSLDLTDERFSFRGFQPLHFRLGGAKGKWISNFPERASIPGDPRDARFGFSTAATKNRLLLEFVADRPHDELAELEDLFLWYRGARLLKLNFKIPDHSAGKPSGDKATGVDDKPKPDSSTGGKAHLLSILSLS